MYGHKARNKSNLKSCNTNPPASEEKKKQTGLCYLHK